MYRQYVIPFNQPDLNIFELLPIEFPKEDVAELRIIFSTATVTAESVQLLDRFLVSLDRSFKIRLDYTIQTNEPLLMLMTYANEVHIDENIYVSKCSKTKVKRYLVRQTAVLSSNVLT